MSRHISATLGFFAGVTSAAVTSRDIAHWIVALFIGLVVACLSRIVQYRVERWAWYRRFAKLPAILPSIPPPSPPTAPQTPPVQAGVSALTESDPPPAAR